MFLTICKSKLHRATVTQAELHYEGSITIDTELLTAAGILPFERVQVVDIANGARFETYAIEGRAGSRTVCDPAPPAIAYVSNRAPFAMSTTWTRSNGRIPAAASSSLSIVMLPW